MALDTSWYDKYFRQPFLAAKEDESSDETKRAREEASWVLSFAQHPYYEVFMSWVERQIDKPIPTSQNHADMIANIARANTFKEVRSYFKSHIGQAESVVQNRRETE